jgi:hypothetical protein
MTQLIVTLTIFNVLFHVFLDRFFNWYDASSTNGRKFFMIFMLIPPLSVVVALFLITLGSFLHLIEKIKKK